jgi:hypothetical protein
LGQDIHSLPNLFNLTITRPFERGYMCSSYHQNQILDNVFTNFDPESSNIVVTEPVLNFEKIRKDLDETLYETYNFAGVARQTTAKMASYVNIPGFDSRACVVVDSGEFSTLFLIHKSNTLLLCFQFFPFIQNSKTNQPQFLRKQFFFYSVITKVVVAFFCVS